MKLEVEVLSFSEERRVEEEKFYRVCFVFCFVVSAFFGYLLASFLF